MNKVIIFLLILLLTNCDKNRVIKTHGIAYLEKRQKNLIVNEVNKNDVRSALGNPSTTGTFENTIWIYIERTTTRGKLLKLGQNVTLKNNVLVLKFDRYGVLAKKDFYDIKNMNRIKFSNETTVGINREQDFIYSFLSSLRKKMFNK